MMIRQNDSNIAAICMFKTKKVSYLLGLLVKWSDIAKELSDFFERKCYKFKPLSLISSIKETKERVMRKKTATFKIKCCA